MANDPTNLIIDAYQGSRPASAPLLEMWWNLPVPAQYDDSRSEERYTVGL